jgi:acyl-CoA synthetase (NDP forming)
MLDFKNIQSVAIIGASEDAKKIGNILLEKNQQFIGNIYGINPKWGTAYGKDFYLDIVSLPEIPDIAVFAIPEVLIYGALEEAWKHGIKKAIIITAGFKEVGNIEWEKKLQAIAKKYNIRLLGPNCLGYGDTSKWLNLSFWGNFFDRWNIGIISQSGAMAVAITDVLAGRYLWFSTFFTLGNKSDIDESDILQELYDDPNTEVLAIYLESISRGKLFIEILQKITPKKPVIIMIGGVSEKWKIATASHTGSLSGNRWIYEAAIKQGGAILTYSLDEFFDLVQIFSLNISKEILWEPYIITNAWWPWVLATDQSEFHNMSIATIDTNTSNSIRYNMPTMMSSKNPIDIIGDANSIRVKQILMNLATVRTQADIIFLFTVQATTDIDTIANSIILFLESHENYNIFVGLIGGDTISVAQTVLSQAGIFVTTSTESIVGAYAHLIEWKLWKKQKTYIAPLMSTQWDTIPVLLDQNKTESLLSEYNIQTSNTIEYRDMGSLLKYANRIAGPYVLKISWKHIAHKTEIWGVIGPLYTQEEIISAYGEIEWNIKKYLPNEKIEWITIGKYITPSPRVELFFGAKRDPNFWDIFVIGAGGIFLTILNDTHIHVGKIDIPTIVSILESLRSYPAMCGYRKQEEVNIATLSTMLYNLSVLFSEHTEIQEIDINPILFEHGIPCIADAKFYLDSSII